MKKATMKSLVAYLDDIIGINGGEDATEDFVVAARNEMIAELTKGEAKAQANRDAYTEAKDIVLSALSETPVTVAELYEEIKDRLPANFSKSKVQYGLNHMWVDEVVKTEGKVNTYTRA